MDLSTDLVLVLAYFVVSTSALKEGEECVSSVGWDGVCLLSYECSSLGAEVDNGYTPELCNTTGPVICCPKQKKIPVVELPADDNKFQLVASEQRERPLFTPAKPEASTNVRKISSMYIHKGKRRRPSRKRHAHILVKTYDDDVNSIRIRTHRVKHVGRRKRKPIRRYPMTSTMPIDFRSLTKQQLESQYGAHLGAEFNARLANVEFNKQLTEAQLGGDEEAALLLADLSQAQTTARPSRSSQSTRISQLMCETFGELVSETVAELSKNGLLPVKSEKCSLLAKQNRRSNSAVIGEFPHVVGLGYSDTSRRIIWGKCSGALISDQYVLTSAHCTQSPIGKPVSVALGSVTLAGEIEIGISEISQHPHFNKTTFANNIALLKLSKILKLSDTLRPACLPVTNAVPLPKYLTAAYWSNAPKAVIEIKVAENETHKFSDPNSLTLEKMKMNYIKNTDCDIATDLTDSFMCAQISSLRSSHKCQGKGGDPLQMINPGNKCMYTLLGLSVENICDESVPIAFTKVNNFLPWIESIVWS